MDRPFHISARDLPDFRDKDPFEYNLAFVTSVGRNHLVVESALGEKPDLGCL